MPDILTAINCRLTCACGPEPRQAIGECAAIDHAGIDRHGRAMCEAYLHLWDDGFFDWDRVAQWFIETGAHDPVVMVVMHDDGNDINNGRSTYDGSRTVIVSYKLPPNDKSNRPAEAGPVQ